MDDNIIKKNINKNNLFHYMWRFVKIIWNIVKMTRDVRDETDLYTTRGTIRLQQLRKMTGRNKSTAVWINYDFLS